jgi:SAM-dependent methyltransferase
MAEATADVTTEPRTSSASSFELLDRVDALLSAELAEAGPVANRAGLRRLSILLPFGNVRWQLSETLERLSELRLPVDFEVLAIDLGATDGSVELIEEWSQRLPQLRLLAGAPRGGVGEAFRLGIAEMRGDVAVLHDTTQRADLAALPRLLLPLLQDRADAVFASRFVGREGLCPRISELVAQRVQATLASGVTGLRLSALAGGYKIVRGDVLRELRLAARGVDWEAELVCRLAQWNARICELPLGSGGGKNPVDATRKKFRKRDLLRSWATLLHRRWLDPQFSHLPLDALLRSGRHLRHYRRWLHAQAAPFLGERLLAAGAASSGLSGLLLDRPRTIFVDTDGYQVERLQQCWGPRGSVRIELASLEDRQLAEQMGAERLDTIYCAQSLQRLDSDFLAIRNCFQMLQPGGRLVALAAADPRLWCRLDRAAGHQRRYEAQQLEQLFERAGFEIEALRPLGRLPAIGWWINGRLLGRRRVGSLQTLAFDQLWRAARLWDGWLPIPASSLLVVGRKPRV